MHMHKHLGSNSFSLFILIPEVQRKNQRIPCFVEKAVSAANTEMHDLSVGKVLDRPDYSSSFVDSYHCAFNHCRDIK
jgi:hypothetical protein